MSVEETIERQAGQYDHPRKETRKKNMLTIRVSADEYNRIVNAAGLSNAGSINQYCRLVLLNAADKRQAESEGA